MTAVFGILVGIIGGIAALMFTAMFGGLLLGLAKGIRESKWPGLPVALTACVWLVATAVLIGSLPVMLGAWMADADQVLGVAGRIAGYCFWPALVGLPLCLWIGEIVGRSHDAG